MIHLQETCLASKDVMSFDLLKKKLMLRLDTLGIKTIKEVNLYNEIYFFFEIDFVEQ